MSPAPLHFTRARPRLRSAARGRGVALVVGGVIVHASAMGATEPPPAPDEAEYVDKVMKDAPLLPDVAADDAAPFDASGAPRSLRMESRAQSSSNDQGRESSAWFTLRGAVDTANYGSLSLDASGRLLERTTQQRRGAGLSFSLYQNLMPFGGGLYASQGLGVIQTLSPRLGNQQASFFVPTRLVQGASTQWRNESDGVTWQFSGGETGSFSSIGQGSFYGSGNQVAVFGFEVQPARPGHASVLPVGWSYSSVLGTASGSAEQTLPGYGLRSAEPAGSGAFQSLRWESNNAFVQGNLFASRNEDPAALAQGTSGGTKDSRVGTWLDGASQAGETTQRWGLHRLAPSLSWQGVALGGNSQGGYYRWSQQGLRTQVEAQVSRTQPVDASAGGITLNQAGVSMRRLINQQLGLGGLLQVSEGTASGWQLSGYAELRRPWAELRLQAGAETSSGQVVVKRMASDQAWTLPVGQRFSSSEALVWTRSGAQDANGTAIGTGGTALELAAAGGTDATDRLTLDLNARISLPMSSEAPRVYNVSASSQWRFTRGWSLVTALGLSRASSVTTTTTTASPIPGLPGSFTSTTYPGTSSRDLWVTLRYDFQAGSASVPIGAGGRAGAGGGNIEGIVYLDDNHNGRADALETRAANVTVTLDGRYSTRTDAQGRFEFPFVAPGAHAVLVAADTLPLPWLMPRPEPLRVEVSPRETSRVEIGATRERTGASDE